MLPYCAALLICVGMCLPWYILFSFVVFQGKGTCKTYWLISAVKRTSNKVNKLLHPNGQPLMNYLNAPGHHLGSNSSLNNLKRTESLRRSMKASPNPVKKSWHKADDESAALLNQTSVWPLWPRLGAISVNALNLVMVRSPRQERVREIVRKSSTCSGIAREEFWEICQRCQRCLGNEENILDLLEPLNIGNFSNVMVLLPLLSVWIMYFHLMLIYKARYSCQKDYRPHSLTKTKLVCEFPYA